MKISVPLDEIKAFVDVAQAGSFSGAAARLNVAHSSLSRKVDHLEHFPTKWIPVGRRKCVKQ